MRPVAKKKKKPTRLRKPPTKGRFYAIHMTWNLFRAYRTKGAAEKGLKAWVRRHESLGFNVEGAMARGAYRAFTPKYGFPIASAIIHEYKDGRKVS